MIPEYIIVQAGGKGTRLEHLTRNKPKPLVPVNNLPMMFHLFRKFPSSKYLIIGDYKFDVMKSYLASFAEVDYELIDARGFKGTCAGLKRAIENVPEDTPFLLTWGDLILGKDFQFKDDGNYVGLSKDFQCRWKFEDNIFSENPSTENGVAGLFFFKDKEFLTDVPEDGEFVRWLSTKDIDFGIVGLQGAKEYGLLSEYNKLKQSKCRPFNSVRIEHNLFIKEPIDEQGRDLAVKEVAWYKKLEAANFKNLPKIYDYEPLKMEVLGGPNAYECGNLEMTQKREILNQIIECLKGIHNLESALADLDSFWDAYVGKTYKRLSKCWDLVPFARDKQIVVNGFSCPNPLYLEDDIKALFSKYVPKDFKLLHGDCTFSNTMLREDLTPVLIDPRGYFGNTQFYGDPAYDWGKVYYSVVGNYDQFNLGHFDLAINDKNAELSIQSNGFEALEDYFFELLQEEVAIEQIKLIHAIIWLSLTTYAWHDFDSIAGSFYQGCLYLKEVL